MHHATKYSVYLGGKILLSVRTKGCCRFSSWYALDWNWLVGLLSNILGNIAQDDKLLEVRWDKSKDGAKPGINHITRFC